MGNAEAAGRFQGDKAMQRAAQGADGMDSVRALEAIGGQHGNDDLYHALALRAASPGHRGSPARLVMA